MSGSTSRKAQRRIRYRMLRAAANLSQLDVATAADMAERRYWKIENGYELPTSEETKTLARIFKLTPEAFREEFCA